MLDVLLPPVMSGIVGEYVNISKPEASKESLYVLDLKELKTFNNNYIQHTPRHTQRLEKKELRNELIDAILAKYPTLSTEAKTELLSYIEKHADDQPTLGDFKNIYQETNKKIE